MRNRKLWQAVFALLTMLSFMSQGTWALAQSTTGNISGNVVNDLGKGVVGASVTAASPSQNAKATTDGSGHFTILSLAPDTYTVVVSAPGITTVSQPGVTVTSGQTLNLNLTANRALQSIGRTTVRSPSDLVHSGITNDVYSVNVATQTAVQTLGGGSNLNNAYSSIVSTPGTYISQGNAGWGQTLFIHGASYSQVGYQYDGIPINRAFDNYNANTLTNLGQQELQVFTGGAPSDSSSQTVGGYINQVIKTGTNPGTATIMGSLGGPTFYHQGRFEGGGATPNRTFSYYVGLSGFDQSYRYMDQSNGNTIAGIEYPTFGTNYTFNANPGVYPQCLGSGQNVDPIGSGAITATGGSDGCLAKYPFWVGALASEQDHESVVNLHFGLPRKSGLRDDIQALLSTSQLTDSYYSSRADYSVFDIAGYSFTGKAPAYQDGVIFPPGTKPLQVIPFGTPVGSMAYQYFFPSSPTGRPFGAPIDYFHRDGIQVDTGIGKLQFQHAFSDHAFVRAYGYTNYSDWLQNGPFTTQALYNGNYQGLATGVVAPDYELITHTRGGALDFVDQINPRNLLQFTMNYTTATTIRDNNKTFLDSGNTSATSLVSTDSAGNFTCYSRITGAVAPCYSSSRGTYNNPAPGTPPAGSPAALAGAQWLVTRAGPSGTYNTVKPDFTSIALSDQINIGNKLLLNVGLRDEQYHYVLPNLADPIHNFWYAAARQSLCYDPTTTQPYRLPLKPGQAPPAAPFVGLNCPVVNGVQLVHPDGLNGHELYTDVVNGDIKRNAFEPRLSGTYTFNRENVLRFSTGKYAQPVQTAYVEYDNRDPSSLTGAGGAGANFVLFNGLGFSTPKHDLSPAISYNSDFSFEHQFHNTDMSISISPFYRRTFNQYQDLVIGPNFASSYPAANQNSFGYEIAFKKGDPSRNGLSGQISYTFTKTGVQFIDTAAGANEIDNVNSYINAFNGLTQAGSLIDPHSPATPKQAGSPCYLGGAAYTGCTVSGNSITMDPAGLTNGAVINPYYFNNPQALLNRTATYPGYQTAPGSPVSASSTISPPVVISGFLSWKKDRLTITPTFQLATGTYYGNPLSVIGYDPRSCGANQFGGGGTLAGFDAKGNPLGVTDNNGNPLGPVPTAPNPGLANYISCGSSQATTNGYLAIPNPETGVFDGFGAFRQPWVLGINAQVGYDLSKRIHANLLLTNLFNRCFGGKGGAWSSDIAPSRTVCGYNASGLYPGNFYNGSSIHDTAANPPVSRDFSHAYSPLVNPFFPFNAYLQVQVKL